MKQQTPVKSKAADLLRWCAVGVLGGGALGLAEAVVYRRDMVREVFGRPAADFTAHLLTGMAFYSQVFLGVMFLAGVFFLFLFPGLLKSGARLRPKLVWAAAVAAMYGGMEINGRIAGVTTWPSLLANAALLAGALVLVVALDRLLQKRGKREKPGRALLILALAVDVIALATIGWLGSERLARAEAVGANAGAGPNIVLITVDTLRADHLSSYGYRLMETPQMDRLAREGVRFARAIAPSSWTLPSLVSIQTGNDPVVHGQMTDDSLLSAEITTAAEALREHGYQTAAFVTNAYVRAKKGLAQGFAVYQHAEDQRFAPTFNGLSLYKFLLPIRAATHAAEEVTRRAIRFLQRERSEPFYLWIHYIDPHVPYGDWYVNEHPAYDRDYGGETGRAITIAQLQEMMSGRVVPPPAEIRHWNACHDAEILYLDRQLGRLLDELDRLGLSENTLTILTADHGEEFWDHDYLCHGNTLYREVVHVPLLARWPGRLEPGRTVGATVSLLDIAPTLFAAAGAPAPPGMQGMDILPLTQAASGINDRTVFSSLKLQQNNMRSAHTDRYDLIHDLGRGETLLFDAQADPEQRHNLAAGQPEVVEELSARIEQWFAGCERLRGELLPGGGAGRIELDEQLRRNLKNLGYIN